MRDKQKLIELFKKQGVLPLFFHESEEVSIEVLKVLYEAGIRAIEYTNRGQAALVNFKAMRQICDQELPEMNLGIGTIKNRNAAKDFIDAGADFIICPGLIPDVVEVVNRHNLLWAPGCMTPSEIIEAENLGAKIIKLFPGSLLGPSFVKSIKSIFPHLLFMPTGGVDTSKENLERWFKSGVFAVGMGSKLVRKDLLETQAYSSIKELTVDTMNLIHTIRERL